MIRNWLTWWWRLSPRACWRQAGDPDSRGWFPPDSEPRGRRRPSPETGRETALPAHRFHSFWPSALAHRPTDSHANLIQKHLHGHVQSRADWIPGHPVARSSRPIQLTTLTSVYPRVRMGEDAGTDRHGYMRREMGATAKGSHVGFHAPLCYWPALQQLEIHWTFRVIFPKLRTKKKCVLDSFTETRVEKSNFNQYRLTIQQQNNL